MIPMFKTAISPKVSEELAKVIESQYIGEGPLTVKWTEKLQEHFQSPYVVVLNSCTSALSLALSLCGVGRGDRVLTSPFSMVATATAIVTVGAEPSWYDPCPHSLSISYSNTHYLRKQLMGSGARALIYIPVGGVVSNFYALEEMKGVCREMHIPFIIDGAHAFATYNLNGKHLSTYADIFCASFQSIKHCSTPDSGALVINKDMPTGLFDRAKRLKWFGLSREVPDGMTRLAWQMTQDIKEAGQKIHSNDVTSAFGLGNFELALENVKKSADNAKFYLKEFSRFSKIQLPAFDNNGSMSWWVFGFLAEQRDALMAHLAARGIESTTLWKRSDRYSAFKASNFPTPGMDAIEQKALFIPNGFWITEEERKHISETIKDFYA